MEEVLPPSEHEVVPPTAPPAQDEIQKSSRDTSTSGDAAAAKQTIVEVPNGATIDGQPLQPGPQYKRGRGRSFFKDAPRKGVSCQVPGCDRSLHKLREYYKRYKICPYHLELNCMVVEGQSIRFCQQCGRFQLLDEFDGDRRSCRRKLEKHNERRRKLEGCLTDSDSGGEGSGRSRSGLKYPRSGGSPPRPWGIPGLPIGVGQGMGVNQMLQNIARDEYLMNGLGSSLAGGMHSLASVGWMPSTSTGGGVVGSTSNGVSVGGSGSHMHPDLVAVLAEVAAANNPATNHHHRQQQQQQQQQLAIPVLVSEPAHPTAVRSSPGVTADALQQFLRDSGGANNGGGCAATTTNTTSGGVPSMKSEQPVHVGGNGSAFAWPHNGTSTQATDAASGRPATTNHNTNGNARPDNSRVAALAAAAAAASADEQLGWDGGAQQQTTTGAQLGDIMRSLQSQMSNGTSHQPSSSVLNHLTTSTGGPFHPGAPSYALSGALGNNAQAPIGQLFNLLQQLQSVNNSPYIPAEQDVMTLSMKLFKMTPAQLPPGLLHELTAWMTKTPTYGEIAARPGCVHLTTSILSTESERSFLDKSICDTVHRALRNTGLGNGGPAAEALLLQMQSMSGPKAAIVLDGQLKMVLDLAATDAAHRPPVPTMFAVKPLAATPEYKGSFLVLGQGMDQNGRIYCRTQGKNAQVEVINRGPALLDENNCDASATGGGWMHVAIPHLASGGYAMEIARGPFASSPFGFVVIGDPVAVAEVRQLESDSDGVVDVAAFIQKLGLVVQMRNRVDTGVSLQMEMQDETVDRIARVAQEVAAVSIKKGWPGVLGLTLPVLSAAMPAAQGLDCVSQLLGKDVTHLSAAVVTNNAALVEVLGAWAALHNISLLSVADDQNAPTLGLNAMHLAAMLNDPCAMATALNKWVIGANGAWSVAPAAAGVSPLSIATSLGQDDLLQMLVLQGVPHAAEALAALYKQRDLMCTPSPEGVLAQKPTTKVVAGHQQRKSPSPSQLQKEAIDTMTAPLSTSEYMCITAYRAPFDASIASTTSTIDQGASSSSSPSNSSPVVSTSAGSPDDMSRASSVTSPLQSIVSNMGSEVDIDVLTAAVAAAREISSNRSTRGGVDERRARRRIFPTAPSAFASSSTRFSFSAKLSFVSFIYQIVLPVLLPALLPEPIALGAAVLPTVVVASFSTFNEEATHTTWSMFCAALMTLMAVTLNRSAAMASVRASAFEVLCTSPHIRAIISTLWLLAITKTLGFGTVQNSILALVNATLTVNSGKEAWASMTGAMITTVFLVVCLPRVANSALVRRSVRARA